MTLVIIKIYCDCGEITAHVPKSQIKENFKNNKRKWNCAVCGKEVIYEAK